MDGQLPPLLPGRGALGVGVVGVVGVVFDGFVIVISFAGSSGVIAT